MIEFVKNFWCQKVLPLVYTDALSYYEMLGKFVGKLNEVIGNVNNLNENTVFSVNNVKPVNGNVTIDASSFEGFVSGVNGKKPDAGGEVTLTAEDVGAVPDTTVVVSSVNGIAPTEGNVNVGTVKTVNGSAPDESGNVNLPQVSGVTSVDGIGAGEGGDVKLGAVRNVNGYTPDKNGIIPGVSAVSIFSYISTWNTAKDIYDFAVNNDNSKKLFYASIWHENNYPWWNAELFGNGDFILTILNLASSHQPEIILRSLERGDIFVLHREGESPNNTYVWRPNFGNNVVSVNGYNGDEHGVIDGVSAVSLYPYVGTWTSFADIFNFATDAAHQKKLYYCSIYHDNSYAWWDTSKFGMGTFILTILNLDNGVAPLIELRSVARGDVFLLDRWGTDGNYTYPWTVNYGTNVKTINNIAPDENGNVGIGATTVGAIPSAENAVTFSNVNANGLYPKLTSITTPTAIINEDWGRFVYLSNDVTSITLQSETANTLSDSWHSIIMNGGSNNINVTLSAWLVDLDNGTNGMGNTFQLPAGKYIEIQRFSTAGFMLRGSFTRP